MRQHLILEAIVVGIELEVGGAHRVLGVDDPDDLAAPDRDADIVDGRLYLFLNAAVFEAYKKDKAGILAKAAKNWPNMHHRSVAEVNGLGS